MPNLNEIKSQIPAFNEEGYLELILISRALVKMVIHTPETGKQSFTFNEILAKIPQLNTYNEDIFVAFMQKMASSHLIFNEDVKLRDLSLDLSMQLMPVVKDVSLAPEIRGVYAKNLLDLLACERMADIAKDATTKNPDMVGTLEELVTPEINGYVELIDSLLNG